MISAGLFDAHLWPMTKRMMTPFSSSNFFLFSPTLDIGKKKISVQINYAKYHNNHRCRQNQKPWGIQVERTESLRLRLLKAVFTPTTMKYFRLPLDPVSFMSSDIGEPFSIDSCVALAAANSISRFDIVLSSVLQHKVFELPLDLKALI